MPRRPRIDIPNMVFHVYTRGHNRMPLFYDDEDRFIFLKHLRRAIDRFPLDCLDFSLMTNHYHLQVLTRDIPLAKTMHNLNTLYAGHFNHRYKRMGNVFQNRFHSIPVQVDRYLLVLSRYINRNPVEAGIVSKPEDYRWSGYRDYLGLANTGLIRTDLVLDTLCENKDRQRLVYKQFVEDKNPHRSEIITEDIIWKTRVFGDDRFSKAVFSKSPYHFLFETTIVK